MPAKTVKIQLSGEHAFLRMLRLLAMQQKSTYEIWQRWAKVLSHQLRLTQAVYEENEDTEGATRVRELANRIDMFIDPVKHAEELAQRNYDVKGGVNKIYLLSLTMLQSLFREAIHFLPSLSADMQHLLKSPCFGNTIGRVAADIFKGPRGEEKQGIGNGEVDVYGYLPWMLAKLLEEAELGGEEYFNKGLSHETHGEGDSGEGDVHPDRQKFYSQNMHRKSTKTSVD